MGNQLRHGAVADQDPLVDLVDLGFEQAADLRGANPETMFDELCTMRGEHIDRCVIYVFRCAVYYAEHHQHDPEVLKWWNWKNER